MAGKQKYALFTLQEFRKAVITDNGVYQEVDCYIKGREEDLYIRHRGGFIKLLGKLNTKNTYGSTSHPKVRWVEVSNTPHF